MTRIVEGIEFEWDVLFNRRLRFKIEDQISVDFVSGWLSAMQKILEKSLALRADISDRAARFGGLALWKLNR